MSATERTPLIAGPAEQSDVELPASPQDEPQFSFKTVSRRKKFILISMAFVNFCAAACFSLPAPFFPQEANAKGASSAVVGLIFGMFEFLIFISSPIYGNFISVIGCKFMFVSGVMVCGSCAILFGTLNIGPDGTIFIVMCFLCRGLEALGASAYITALFAILAHEFPDNVITVMGMLETFSGLGMMVGPPIGGVLYELGGFGLPFFILGAVVILCGSIIACVMPSISEGKKMYKGSILTMLKSPFVIVTFINIVAGSVSLGFMDPTLSNHLLDQFGLKTWLIGLMFLIAPGVYAFTAPVWGYLGDKKGKIRLMIFAGSAGAIISMLLLGPSPLTVFVPNKLYINVIALALVGLTVGCGLIPTFKALLLGANSLGMPNNLDTYGKVSGFFNSSFSLGAFLGPTIGGSLVENFGFPWACTWVAGIFTFAAILMLAHMLLVPKLPTLPDDEKVPISKNVEVSVNASSVPTNPNDHSKLEASQTTGNPAYSQLSASDEQQKSDDLKNGSAYVNGPNLSDPESQRSVNLV